MSTLPTPLSPASNKLDRLAWARCRNLDAVMNPIYLFEIASRSNKWLGVRQSAIAGNIANANTPGFKARDVITFAQTLDSTRAEMTRTMARHISAAPKDAPAVELREQRSWEILHSGNTVSLEQELIKSSEVKNAFALNAAVMKAFHRMILASAKG